MAAGKSLSVASDTTAGQIDKDESDMKEESYTLPGWYREELTRHKLENFLVV